MVKQILKIEPFEYEDDYFSKATTDSLWMEKVQNNSDLDIVRISADNYNFTVLVSKKDLEEALKLLFGEDK